MGDDQLYDEESRGKDGLAAYKYDPISPEEIRCLVLEPGRGKEPLSCTLEVRRLADNPPYEAVSYVWGQSSKCHKIKCDGCRLFITPNLRDALHQCRLPDESRVLWADSVCINQGDSAEKSHQVSLMSKVYSQATRVLICLGPDRTGGCAQQAQSCLYEFNQFFEGTVKDIRGEWDAFPYHVDSDPLVSDPRWPAIGSLTGQPWFKRGWVVQEAYLAKVALICWGESQIDWLWLLRSITWAIRRCFSVRNMLYLPPWYLHLMMYMSRYKDEGITMWQRGSLKAHSLIDALDDARDLDFTDERDRIYAFLGLPEAAEIRDGISIDYADTNTTSQVFQDFACRYLDCTHDLRLLHSVQPTEDILSAGSDYPSWAPQWQNNRYVDKIQQSWHARFVSQDSPMMPWVFSREGDSILKVRGLVMDSIVYSSSLLSRSATIGDMAAIWREVICCCSRPIYEKFPPLYAFIENITCGSLPASLSDEQREAAANACFRRLDSGADDLGGKDAEVLSDVAKDDLHDPVGTLWQDIQHNICNRRVAVTRRGYYCLVPGVARVGDKCAVIFGTSTTLILRGLARQNYHKVVGEAYITSRREVDVEAGSSPYRVGSGINANEDWLDWGLKEEDIWLC